MPSKNNNMIYSSVIYWPLDGSTTEAWDCSSDDKDFIGRSRILGKWGIQRVQPPPLNMLNT